MAQDRLMRLAVIDGTLRIADPTRDSLAYSDRILLPAVAQGLVAFDNDGQVDQGLAEAWTVTDDGLSYIFRLREAEWSDGEPITPRQVADILRARVQDGSRNRLRHEFASVDTIRAMTDDVLEIRLVRPRSDLLDLLAQPELAIVSQGRGWGPLRAAKTDGGWTLTPMPDPLFPDDDGPSPVERSVTVVVAPAARALALFGRDDVDGALGGRFEHFPLFLTSGIDADRLAIDPSPGLFGLAFVEDRDFLSSARNREALSMAIDRDRLLGAFGIQGWMPQLSMRPQLANAAPQIAPVSPAWADQPIAARRLASRRIVAQWRANGRAIAPLRIALPDGVGARVLFAAIKADLAAIDVAAERVGLTADADLRLIDQVAPSDSPLWLINRLSCDGDVICDAIIEAKLARAEATDDLVDRQALIAEVDGDLSRFVPYIPLATPLRWSVVADRLTGFRANSRARHPLDKLLDPSR